MTPPPDRDDELDELRLAATAAGIPPLTHPDDLGMTLEPATAIIARASAVTPDELAGRRRWRLPVLAASAAAAASIVVAAVLQPWGTARVAASTPDILDYEFAAAAAISYAPGEDPSSTFAELSAAAGGTAPPPPPTGLAQHVVTDNWFAEVATGGDQAASVLVPQISETWLGPDGALRLVERRDKPLAADGRGLPLKGAWDRQPPTADETQPPGTLDPDLVSTLSREPSMLRSELLERGACTATAAGTSRSRCLYEQVVDLTRTYVVPRDLYAALWSMLAGEDGFRLLGSVTDRAGRAGTGISLVADDRPEYRMVLIADPADGTLLGTEEILVRSVPGLALKPPAITSFTAILESRYVDPPT